MADRLPSKHHLSDKNIVIAGAGIAGLSFAIAITKQWHSTTTAEPPKITIYERDSAEDTIGREGYSLSLRSDPPGGIQALQKLGIIGQMIEASIKDVVKKNGGFVIWGKDWSEIIKVRAVVPRGLPVGSLRIARKNLRKIMIDAAEEAGCQIHWGVRCTSVSSSSKGLTVALSNGEEVACDMLVAADGASSRLRAQLRPDDNLQFLNTVCFGGTAVFPEGTSPPEPIDRDWGLMPLNRDRTAIFFSPVGPNTALWSVSYRTETQIKPSKPPVSEEVANQVLKEARERVKNPPRLWEELLERTDRDTIMTFNARDKVAFAHGEETLPKEFANGKVVFLGDANHAVSPFAGNGANMALCDGWELASALLQASSVRAGVEKYDKVVVPQRNRVTRQSHVAIGIAHSEGWKLWWSMLFLRVMRIVFFKYVR